jgi:hypothetical protein
MLQPTLRKTFKFLGRKETFGFSVYSNQPVKYREKFEDRYIYYDKHLESYELSVQALLYRRWIRKQEVGEF